jgi:hypothetical protein
MRNSWILFLLAANIMLAAMIAYITGQGVRNDRNVCFGLTSEQLAEIKRIVLIGQNEADTRILERRSDQWEVVAPGLWPANYFAVKHILGQIAFIEEEIIFDVDDLSRSGQTLADYGLENPLLTLKLESTGQSWEFKIGQSTALGNRVYLLSPAENKIVVVDRSLLDSLICDVAELRSPEVFSLPAFEIHELSVHLSHPSAVKMRLVETDNKWVFQAPVVAKADSRAVENALSSLLALSVERFVPTKGHESAFFGLDDPVARISIEGRDRRQTLLIGHSVSQTDRSTEYFASIEGNPMVFTVDSDFVDNMMLWQERLRDAHLVDVAPEKISSIEIIQSNISVRLQKLETEEWQVYGKDHVSSDLVQYSADKQIVHQLLLALSTIQAQNFVSDAPSQADLEKWGFNSPTRELTIKGGVSGTQELIIGDIDLATGLAYAKIGSSASVYQIPMVWLESVPVNLLYYRNHVLEDFPERAELISVEVRTLADDRVCLSWTHPVDSIAVDNNDWSEFLRSAILNWRVESYLDVPFSTEGVSWNSKATVPWFYRLEAKVSIPGLAQPRTFQIYLTSILEGAVQVGGSAQLGSVFMLSQMYMRMLEVALSSHNN